MFTRISTLFARAGSGLAVASLLAAFPAMSHASPGQGAASPQASVLQNHAMPSGIGIHALRLADAVPDVEHRPSRSIADAAGLQATYAVADAEPDAEHRPSRATASATGVQANTLLADAEPDAEHRPS